MVRLVISHATYRGGSREMSFGVNTRIAPGARVILATATAAALRLGIPLQKHLRGGRLIVIVANVGAETFLLRYQEGAFTVNFGNIAAGQVGGVSWCGKDSFTANDFIFVVRNRLV